MKKFLFVTAFTLAMGGTGMAQNVNPFLQEKYGTPYEIAPFEKISIDNYREAFLKGMEDELNQQDTGIVGLDAAKEYLKNVKEVSSGTLDDSLVKEQKKRPLCVRML